MGSHDNGIHILHDRLKRLSMHLAGNRDAVIIRAKDQKQRHFGNMLLTAVQNREAFLPHRIAGRND